MFYKTKVFWCSVTIQKFRFLHLTELVSSHVINSLCCHIGIIDGREFNFVWHMDNIMHTNISSFFFPERSVTFYNSYFRFGNLWGTAQNILQHFVIKFSLLTELEMKLATKSIRNCLRISIYTQSNWSLQYSHSAGDITFFTPNYPGDTTHWGSTRCSQSALPPAIHGVKELMTSLIMVLPSRVLILNSCQPFPHYLDLYVFPPWGI
jgi:hypothetical protein